MADEIERLRTALQEIIFNAERGQWTLPSSFAARARTALSSQDRLTPTKEF